MDAHTNVESLTFNVRHNENALPIVFIQEPMSKASIPIPIPDINPLQPPLGVALPIPTRIDLMKDTAKLSPIAAIAKGVAAAAGSADLVEGSGSLNVCAMDGCSRRASSLACAAPEWRSTACTTSRVYEHAQAR
jgi:hypothetical protein